MLNVPSFLVGAPDPARFPAGQARLGSAASTAIGDEQQRARAVLGAGEVENDLAADVAAFQYPVGLGRCREGEHVADDGP